MKSRKRIIVAVLAAAAVGAVVVTVLGSNGPLTARTAIVPAVAIAGGAAVFVAIVVVRARRGRAPGPPSRAEAEAARLGFSYRETVESGFHHEFGPLPGIPRGGTVKHVFTGTLDGRAFTAFQHSYVINTGQAVIPVYHTAYVTSAPDWPSVTIARRRFMSRLMYRFGSRRGLLLEDPAFNRTMRLKTDDEDFALTLVHPDMQQFLTEKPSAVWRTHAGCCALIYSGALRVDRMEASMDRLRRFWSLIPPELIAW